MYSFNPAVLYSLKYVTKFVFVFSVGTKELKDTAVQATLWNYFVAISNYKKDYATSKLVIQHLPWEAMAMESLLIE